MLQQTQYLLWDSWHNKYGKTISLLFGPKLLISTIDPEFIQEVFIKQFANFTDRILEGKAWKRVRNTLTPTFSNFKMKQMFEMISEKVDILMDKMAQHAASGHVFNIYDDFQGLTLDVIGRCAFGMDTDCQRNDQDPFFVHCRAFVNASDPNKDFMMKYGLILPEIIPFLAPFRNWSSMGIADTVLIKGLHGAMMDRKKAMAEGAPARDALQLMLESVQKDHSMSEDDITATSLSFLLAGYETTSTALAYTAWLLARHPEVQDHLVAEIQTAFPSGIPSVRHSFGPMSEDDITATSLSFLLAGYETTSTAFAYTAWLLARHPEVQDRLVAEIQTAFPTGIPSGEETYDRLKAMEYLDAVFHESCRILPPVIKFTARTCVRDTVVCGQRVPAGTVVDVPTYSLHHQEALWPHHDVFDPERFLHGRKEALEKSLVWQPFGVGPRNCIGMRFAIIEYKLALCRLLSRYSVKLPPTYDGKWLKIGQQAILLRPIHGVNVIVADR